MHLARAGVVASWCLAGAILVVAPDASAQQKGGAGNGPARSSTQFTLKREAAGGPEGETARARARAGDCAGALPAFDAAIGKTIEPALRRDRGLCHEKLGHPYPAIEDYRAYLLAAPEAADSEQIRQRLEALEGQEGGGAAEPRSSDEGPSEVGASFAIGGRASASASTAGAAADGSTSTEPGTNYDYDRLVARERLADAAETSPLRYGKGVVLGPFFHMPRFFLGEQARDQLGYGVGLALRYSTGPTVSVISEIGYAGVGTSGAMRSQAGPLLFAGVELRLPVSPFASDHILLRGGLGYERHVVSGNRAVIDHLLGRVGLGYRHVFGPSLGLEFLADGGPAYLMAQNGKSLVNFLLGGSVAFVVGF